MAKHDLSEYMDMADALASWFQSQDVEPFAAVTTMAILTGALAGHGAETMDDAKAACAKTQELIDLICQRAYKKSHS